MEKIIQRLYIADAKTLLELGVDHEFDEVVSLGYRTHLGLGDSDPSTTDDRFVFPDGPHEYAVFEAAVDYTVDCLERGETVLVHCQAGVSRSAGVCAAAVGARHNLTADQALAKVKQARPIVDPTEEISKSTVRYITAQEQG